MELSAIDELINALAQKGVDSVIAGLSGPDDSVRVAWLGSAVGDLQGAIRKCFALRKLGRSAAVASYYLAKALFNLDSQKALNAFGWCALAAVKGLRDEGYEKKKSYNDLIVSIVEELSALKIDGTSEYDAILSNQIRHYKTEYLATEDHLAEAFNEQRAIYLEDPDDLDNLRSLGWTLHDCLRQSMATLKNRRLVQFFLDELSRLKYPEALKERDEKLVNCRDSDIRKAKDFLAGTGEIRALMAGGNLDAALGLASRLVESEPQNAAAHLALGEIHDKLKQYRKALKEYLLALKPDGANASAQTGAAWAFFRYVSEALKGGWTPTAQNLSEDGGGAAAKGGNATVGRDVLRLCLVEKLTELQKPSLAYSQLLRVYTKVVKAAGKDVPPRLARKYLEVVGAWNLDNLSDEDWKPFIPKDKPGERFPSLAENVVSALYRCGTAKGADGRAQVRSFPQIVGFVGAAVERFPKQEWFPYYHGRLLVELGRCEEARKRVVETARRKMSEFWVWQLLAETYPDDADRRLACLCRAASCHAKDESYLVAVHEMLGDCLCGQGMASEAAFEYAKVDAIRAGKGWRAVRHAHDVGGVSPAKDNAALYRRLAEGAEAVVLENVPGLAAVVTARYVDRETKAEIVKVWWTDGEAAHEARAKARRFAALKKAAPGMPVTIWADKFDGKTTILKVERRKDGMDWDVYPKRIGVVSAHDERHGRSYFAIGERGESCSGDWAVHPALKALDPGTVCELAVSVREGKMPSALGFSVVTDGALPPFARDFSGTLQRPDGRRFGFVKMGAFASDVFVPDDVLVGDVADGTPVTGVAVRSFDRVKNKVSWRAVTLEAAK